MPRHKKWWGGRLFAYGPGYTKGKIEGFNISVRLDDGTESGRFAEIRLNDAGVRNLMGAMEQHMQRDRSQDADPEEAS